MAKLNHSARQTLAYYRRGFDLNPDNFYLKDDATPRARMAALHFMGYLEQSRMPGGSDLYRITAAGIEALDDA